MSLSVTGRSVWTDCLLVVLLTVPHSRQTQVVSSKIDNRKRATRKLSAFVSRMSITTQLVDAIANAPVGHVFLAAVCDLHEKLQFIAKLPPNTPSLGDVSADLNSLRIKVNIGSSILCGGPVP